MQNKVFYIKNKRLAPKETIHAIVQTYLCHFNNKAIKDKDNKLPKNAYTVALKLKHADNHAMSNKTWNFDKFGGLNESDVVFITWALGYYSHYAIQKCNELKAKCEDASLLNLYKHKQGYEQELALVKNSRQECVRFLGYLTDYVRNNHITGLVKPLAKAMKISPLESTSKHIFPKQLRHNVLMQWDRSWKKRHHQK